MKALIQRVSEAGVTIEGEVTGKIGQGILVFLGVTHTDTEKNVDQLVEKIVNLRIFVNEAGKLDRSLIDIKGSLLIVSQFTLYASTDKGRRPDFFDAARPDIAEPLYNKFVQKCREKEIKTETGRFGAMMQVNLVNDGPVTLIIESA
ncbi:MAG: D-aminoacyl-tRNA deacylase [Patescibacteria group bacterium]